MRLVVLDEDMDYANNLLKYASSYKECEVSLCLYNQLEDVIGGGLTENETSQYDTRQNVTGENVIGQNLASQCGTYQYDTILLIHETFLRNGIDELMPLLKGFKGVVVLTEGYLQQDRVNELKAHGCLLVNKYQSIPGLLNYINQTPFFVGDEGKVVEKIVNQKKAKLITIYTPYGSPDFSKRLEELVKNKHHGQSNGKILMIHFDPFYLGGQEVESDKSVSRILSWAKRRKGGINHMLSDLADPQTNCHIVYGPLNMKDVDCLTKEDATYLLNVFACETDYDIILFNICGMHISGVLWTLFNDCDDRVLMTEDEWIQQVFMGQVKKELILMNDKNISGIREMIRVG
jgi:hypothetical protein